MISIEEFSSARDQAILRKLTAVWDKTMRVSHLFLREEDIRLIRPYVGEVLSEVRHLLVAYDDGKAIGFMGIMEGK